jgi:DNA invertase Pin-like site-specific DNA recombinase
MKVKCKLVGYLRVSTKKQGDSGLGIAGQQAAIEEYVQKTGCELVATYSEIETGKKHDLTNRPELRKAIAHARRSKATLVVAKLDRLLRSTVIANMLKTSGVKFVACDNPHLDEFSVDIHAAVAANEVRQISDRTTRALAALKADGVLLGAARPGAPQLTAEARQLGTVASVKASRESFVAAYSDLTEIVGEMRSDGLSLRAIAARLNAMGHVTRRGKQWAAQQVASVLTLVPCAS